MKHHFEKYCKDFKNIENYDKAVVDNFKSWHCHHRLETWTSDGKRRLVDITRKELIALDMYYDRPAEELIFLTEAEHMSLHRKGKASPKKGIASSEETRNKMSKALKGKRSGYKDKHHSVETKKKLSEENKGKHWYNNGKECRFCFECPEGFIPGRLINKITNISIN